MPKFLRFNMWVIVAAMALETMLAASLSGPVTGFVYDAGAREIRPVIGIPGASYLAGSVLSEVEFASIAPNGKVALVFKDGHCFLYRNLLDAETAVDLGPADTPEVVAWRTDASKAAAYNATAGRIVIFSNAQSVVAPEVLDVGYLGKIHRLAFSTRIAAVVSGPEASSVFLLSADGGSQLLGALPRVDALIASPTEAEVFFAIQGEAREMYRMAPEQSISLVCSGDSLAASTVAAMLTKSDVLFTISATEHYVRVFDRKNHVLLGDLRTSTAANELTPLNASSLYVIARPANDAPLLLLDTSASAIYFVPGASK